MYIPINLGWSFGYVNQRLEKNQRGNREWTIQRHWQYWAQDEDEKKLFNSLTHLCFIDNIEHKHRFTTLLHQTPSIRHLLNGMTKERTKTAFTFICTVFTFICTVLPYNKALLSIGYE